jgi:hypothetical protein
MMRLAYYPPERLDAMNRKQLLELETLLFVDSFFKDVDASRNARLMPELTRKLSRAILWLQYCLTSTTRLRKIVKESFNIWESEGTLSAKTVDAYRQKHPD